MKILVVGGGSIGKRHLTNVAPMVDGNVLLVEPDDERRSLVADEAGVSAYASLEAGLDQEPDIALVATPNNLHVSNAITAAERGCHLFIEKPLSHDEEGLDELSRIVDERYLVTMIGCNMRFHPGPARVKKLIDENAVGTLRFLRVHTGSYLPGWRPWQDYRKSYSANRSMGGGVLLDCIHEIDLTRWYAGEVGSVNCTADRIGPLEIDTEDYAEISFQHTGGARSQIHLDYISRTYERGCSVHGDLGTIHWDFGEQRVRHYDAEADRWATYEQPAEWDVNRMYVAEMQYFLACVEAGVRTTLPVDDAARLMRVVFAAKRSAAKGELVAIG